MEAVMLLCDFAESINGKLYIMGGGWSDLHGSKPMTCAVAISLQVPWTQTNQKHKIRLSLFTEDGQEPVTDADGDPVRVDGEFEIGRPAGHPPGSPLVNTMAFRVDGLPLPSGAYRFSFEVDGVEVASTSFRIHRPQEAA